MKYSLIISTCFFLIFSDVHAEENRFTNAEFHCKSKDTLGFQYKKRQREWIPTRFTDINRYIIKKMDSEFVPYQVEDYHTNKYLFSCPKIISKYGYLSCGAPGEKNPTAFRANFISGRYITGDTMTYFNILPLATRRELNNELVRNNREPYDFLTDETSSSPFIEIGTCTKI